MLLAASNIGKLQASSLASKETQTEGVFDFCVSIFGKQVPPEKLPVICEQPVRSWERRQSQERHILQGMPARTRSSLSGKTWPGLMTNRPCPFREKQPIEQAECSPLQGVHGFPWSAEQSARACATPHTLGEVRASRHRDRVEGLVEC